MNTDKLFFILFIILFSAAGCCQSQIQALPENQVVGPDYRLLGERGFSETEKEIFSATGCALEYNVFQPKEVKSPAYIVILAHGFMRSKQQMDNLAVHLASWGVTVVNVSFCNSSWFNGNHQQNAKDLVLIANTFSEVKVVYVGFSAGGLSGILASEMDSRASAFLGMDMVDSGKKAENLGIKMTILTYGLVAPPSACNAHGNGLRFYSRSGDKVVAKVIEASHCHFEFPIDSNCFLVCAGCNDKKGSQEIQKTIRGMVTAFCVWQTGIDKQAQDWWQPKGKMGEVLTNHGAIEWMLSNDL